MSAKNSVKKIILYGSRAKGLALERSDFDIAVTGDFDYFTLEEDLDNIRTLYSIDLLDLENCKDKLLLEDIEKYGRIIYEEA